MKPALALCLLAASAAAGAQTREVPEPQVQRTVIEDEGARIEELRVRGQVQRVVVQPRHGREYEVLPSAAGRDPSQNRGNQPPGAGGQRVWNLLRF